MKAISFLVLTLTLTASLGFAQDSKKLGKSEWGRFQIMQLNDAVRSQYMIDTQTGKIWNRQCGSSKNGECTYFVWSAEDVEGITISKEKVIQKALEYDKLYQNPPASVSKN